MQYAPWCLVFLLLLLSFKTGATSADGIAHWEQNRHPTPFHYREGDNAAPAHCFLICSSTRECCDSESLYTIPPSPT